MTTDNIEKGLTIPHFQPKTDLNEYMRSSENVEINQFLCDWKMNEKERLEYMNYLYFQLQIVLANPEKPSTIISYLLSLYQNDNEDDKINMAFLLENLHIKMTYAPEYKNPALKGKMDIILDMMDDELNRLLEELDSETYGDGVLRNLRRMLPYANTSNDPQEEIKRYLGIKAGLQQNAVLYGYSPAITKALKLIDIELRELCLVHNIPIPSENVGTGTGQLNSEGSGQQAEESSDYSDLLEALSKYIKGINSNEFTNIIQHHALLPRTPKACWIGKKVDADNFATYLDMSRSDFMKCFYFVDAGRLLPHHKDKLGKDSPLIRILQAHLK